MVCVAFCVLSHFLAPLEVNNDIHAEKLLMIYRLKGRLFTENIIPLK